MFIVMLFWDRTLVKLCYESMLKWKSVGNITNLCAVEFISKANCSISNILVFKPVFISDKTATVTYSFGDERKRTVQIKGK
jgi:hypothetical protein